jgi:hypothetical protein
MSYYLEEAAKLDPQRAADLAANDLLDVFPEQVELQALECARLHQVMDSYHRRNDAQAVSLDQAHFDVLRRTGAI